jgi:hypothetical protein
MAADIKRLELWQIIFTGSKFASNCVDDIEAHTDNGRVLMVLGAGDAGA